MLESYEVKERTKKFLKKCGLLDIVATIYHSRWIVWRIKCCIMRFLREKGYQDPDFEELEKYRNIHEGERCFIICTGPSLTLEDVERLKGEYTFSMNSIIKLFLQTDWRPSYYVIEDLDAYMKLEEDLDRYCPTPFFISDWLADRVEPKIETVLFPFDMLNHFSVGFHLSPRFRFSGNAYAMMYNGFSVTFIIMQLAVYMGFKEIYLLGCDCNYSGEKTHFVDYGAVQTSVSLTQKMTEAYRVAKKYADEHGIKIYNATRGGKLEVFERVDFDNVIATRVTNRGGVIRTAKYTGYCGSRTQDLILAA